MVKAIDCKSIGKPSTVRICSISVYCMLKNFDASILNWFDLFFSVNYNFLFFFLFCYIIITLLLSSQIINYFFNIFMFIVVATTFLFNMNVGAFAGFLFLCESVSLFMLFIILSKIESDELFLFKSMHFFKKLMLFVSVLLLIVLYRVYAHKSNIPFDNYFAFELLNCNDFQSIYSLFYSSSYFFFISIIFFLTVVSAFIIILFNSFFSKNTKLKKKIVDNLFNRLFKEYNFVFLKNKVVLQFFRKLC